MPNIRKTRLYNHGCGHSLETSYADGVVLCVPQIKMSSGFFYRMFLENICKKHLSNLDRLGDRFLRNHLENQPKTFHLRKPSSTLLTRFTCGSLVFICVKRLSAITTECSTLLVLMFTIITIYHSLLFLDYWICCHIDLLSIKQTQLSFIVKKPVVRIFKSSIVRH